MTKKTNPDGFNDKVTVRCMAEMKEQFEAAARNVKRNASGLIRDYMKEFIENVGSEEDREKIGEVIRIWLDEEEQNRLQNLYLEKKETALYVRLSDFLLEVISLKNLGLINRVDRLRLSSKSMPQSVASEVDVKLAVIESLITKISIDKQSIIRELLDETIADLKTLSKGNTEQSSPDKCAGSNGG